MKKAFVHFKRQNYANLPPFNGKPEEDLEDQIMIGDYEGQGCTAEFAIEFKTIGNEVTMRLCMYQESWFFIKEYADLFDKLAIFSKKNIKDGFHLSSLLIILGFEDRSDIPLEEYKGD